MLDFGTKFCSLRISLQNFDKTGMIGIFDSGIGGLTVVREIFKYLPGFQVIYFGDTARLPYGTKSKETITKYAIENTEFLLKKGAKIIVIACHTASAFAGNVIKEKYKKIPIFDMIGPTVKASLSTLKNNKLGIIGTPGTISSKIYQNTIEKFLKSANAHTVDLQIYGQACPLLVPLIEEGWIDKMETKNILRYYLNILKIKDISTLILACTHYPVLINAIKFFMGKDVELINPGVEIAKTLKKFIENQPDIEKTLRRDYDHKFYVSDTPYKFQELTKLFLGKEIFVEQVKF